MARSKARVYTCCALILLCLVAVIVCIAVLVTHKCPDDTFSRAAVAADSQKCSEIGRWVALYTWVLIWLVGVMGGSGFCILRTIRSFHVRHFHYYLYDLQNLLELRMIFTDSLLFFSCSVLNSDQQIFIYALKRKNGWLIKRLKKYLSLNQEKSVCCILCGIVRDLHNGSLCKLHKTRRAYIRKTNLPGLYVHLVMCGIISETSSNREALL